MNNTINHAINHTINAIFKKSWLEAISTLSNSLQNKILVAVTRFQLTGEIPTSLKGAARVAISFILRDIDPDFDLSLLDNTVSEQKSETSATIQAEKLPDASHCSTNEPNHSPIDVNLAPEPVIELPSPTSEPSPGITERKLPPRGSLARYLLSKYKTPTRPQPLYTRKKRRRA